MRRGLTASILTLWLAAGLSSSAFAQTRKANPTPSSNSRTTTSRKSLYRPPNASQATGRFTNSARRGSACTPKTDTALTAIAPRTHAGQTLSNTPTLVWHVPDEEPFATRVELLAYDSAEGSTRTSIVKETLQSQPGLMSWTVPEAHRLEPGKLYQWRVIMFCNVNRPLDSVAVSADIQLGAGPDLSAALSPNAAPLQQAEQLAQAGYWYDAMGLLVQQEGGAAAEMRQGMVRSLLELHTALEPTTALTSHGRALEELLQVGL